MASEVDICNIALGHLGDEAEITAISPPDGSAQASHCARIYPMARDELLESHNWRFAVKRAALALVTTTEQPQEWAYSYAYPNSCIRVIAVRPQNEPTTSSSASLIYDQQEFLTKPDTIPFTIETLSDETQVIYTNQENATVHYVSLVTDTTRFSPLFRAALARLMAVYLAGAIIKGKAGMEVAKSQLELYEKIYAPRAKASDSNAHRDVSYDLFLPSNLAARR